MKVRSWRPATALGLSVARFWLCRFETVTAEFLNRCGRRLDHLPFPSQRFPVAGVRPLRRALSVSSVHAET